MCFDNAICSVLVDDAASQAGDLYIRSICFSPDGKYLATGAEDRQIRVSSSLFRSVELWQTTNRGPSFLDLGYQTKTNPSSLARPSARDLLARVFS